MSYTALLGRALTLLRQDDADGALECANEVLETIRGKGPSDKASEVSALCACVDAYLALGDATKALAKAEEALAIAKPLAGSLSEAVPALALAKAKFWGSQESKDALALLREIGATWGETAMLLSLALQAAKDPAKARSLLEIARQKQRRWQEAFAQLTLSLGALSKGSPGLQAVEDFLQIAQKHGVRIAATDVGYVDSGLRRFEGLSTMEDLQDIHDRLSAASKGGQRSAVAWATLDMANAKLGQGDKLQVPEVEEALAQLEKLGTKEGLAMARLEVLRWLGVLGIPHLPPGPFGRSASFGEAMSGKQANQANRRHGQSKRALKAQQAQQAQRIEVETTDTGSSSSEDSGRSQVTVPQMDLLWPSQPLPPGEIRRGAFADLPERCSLLPGQVFRKGQGGQGHEPRPVTPPEAEKAEEKRAGGAKQKAPRPWPSVGRTKEAKKTGTEARPVATPLKVKLPELPGGLDWALPAKKCLPHFPEVSADLMILAQEAQRLDPRLPAKKQLNEFLLKPTRFVL
ncbi:Uncharacterized protein SCF082_LOCUS12727 [Durusdinium trenchii]|uniref:Signal recognition particle subunit SRP72 n=1 Tax=Durusdinium trenchii TaxID=1381693 RepID=A0ABP0JLR1_9DINO